MEFIYSIIFWQWVLVIGSSLLLLLISPVAKNAEDFFRATTKNNQKPGLFLLTSSLVISWIFAKSITNAANLGLKYGILGGMAYATYYFSFLFAGIIIYQLRTKGKYTSIHHFLEHKFGKGALIFFSILIAFRLFNEVWSNTLVIGSYFGENGSMPFYMAIFLFTALTLAYSLKGGLKSTLLTDAIQMLLFGTLLILILGIILPKSEGITSLIHSSSWTLEGGLDLFLVAIIQIFSYPFHDPVMTDRGFITDSKTMRKAFFFAVPIGFICILLFSLIGVYASQQGFSGKVIVEIGKSLGIVAMLAINFIMITSAASTLDSSFASFSKLGIIDLKIANQSVSKGRIVMVFIAIIGTIPIFFEPEILDATTISGTMVIGLAPIFLFWNMSVKKCTFIVVVAIGTLFGIWQATGFFPNALTFFSSDYGALLSANILGTICCFIAFFLCLIRK